MLVNSIQYSAAQELVNIQVRFAKSNRTLSEAALCGAREFIEWRHYPKNDMSDADTGYEFYYHAHSADEMSDGEHGHFHLFKRKGNDFFHLIGIALNQQGLPVRIFTTNQWVTGELMVDSRVAASALKIFAVAAKGRIAPVSKWLKSFIQLFYMDMEALIIERDLRIAALSKKMGDLDKVLKSKEHHVLTECKIDLLERLSQHLSVVN
jgi:hypothetical protein